MSCFDEDQSAEIIMSAADFAIMRDEVVRLESENAALHAECDRLTAMLGLQKVLSADEVTEPGYYWQRDDDNCEWGVNYVSSFWWMTQAGVAERLEIFGQFIGPIKMREVSNA